MSIPIEAFIMFHDMWYEQHPISKIEKGVLVLDTKDDTVGEIKMIHDENRVAVGDGGATELGIHVSRLRQLIPTLSPLKTDYN